MSISDDEKASIVKESLLYAKKGDGIFDAKMFASIIHGVLIDGVQATSAQVLSILLEKDVNKFSSKEFTLLVHKYSVPESPFKEFLKKFEAMSTPDRIYHSSSRVAPSDVQDDKVPAVANVHESSDVTDEHKEPQVLKIIDKCHFAISTIFDGKKDAVVDCMTQAYYADSLSDFLKSESKVLNERALEIHLAEVNQVIITKLQDLLGKLVDDDLTVSLIKSVCETPNVDFSSQVAVLRFRISDSYKSDEHRSLLSEIADLIEKLSWNSGVKGGKTIQIAGLHGFQSDEHVDISVTISTKLKRDRSVSISWKKQSKPKSKPKRFKKDSGTKKSDIPSEDDDREDSEESSSDEDDVV